MSGKRHARHAYRLYSGATQDVALEATNRTRTAEAERANLEAQLGTPDQVAGRGAFDVDARVTNYTSRYTLSPFSGVVPGYTAPKKEELDTTLVGANDLLEKAEAAARGGDFGAAEDFRNQATAFIQNQAGGVSQEFFNLERDPIEGAQASLASPTARLVGGDVLRAGELRDPNSKTYKDVYSSLTDASEAEIEGGYTKASRTIAQGLASGRRDMNDAASSRGAGRNALGEMSLMMRINESASTELANARLDTDIAKAKLFSDATKFMIDYSDSFRKNAVGLARDWVSGTSFVRDDYVRAQNGLSQFTAQIFQQRAAEEYAYAQTQEAREDARAAYYRNLIIAAAAVVLTAGFGAVAGAGFLGAEAAAAVGGSAAAGAWAGTQASVGILAGVNTSGLGRPAMGGENSGGNVTNSGQVVQGPDGPPVDRRP